MNDYKDEDELMRELLWCKWANATNTTREKADRRLKVINTVNKLVELGVKKAEAISLAAPKESRSTIYRWYSLIEGLSKSDWLPALLPDNKGRLPVSKNSYRVEIYSVFKAHYLSPSKHSYAHCYALTITETEERNWGCVPSLYLLKSRLEDDYSKLVRKYMRSTDSEKEKMILLLENKIASLRIQLKILEHDLSQIHNIKF